MRQLLAAGLVLLACVIGCGQGAQVAQMSGGKESLIDPALDSFDSPHLLGLGYAAAGDKPNWSAVKKSASTAEFNEGLASFESAPVPAGGDAAKKAALIAAVKKVAEAGTDEEIEAAYKEVLAAKAAYRN